MKAPAKLPLEAQRLAALRALKVLDTPPVEELDRITRLAAQLFDVPVALISLVDESRQWFKSRVGLAVPETSRDISFCGHAILGQGPLVVPDTHADDRFRDNPLVIGDPHIAFYAGHPLRSRAGLPLGTLCLIDHKPRSFSTRDQHALRDLAAVAESYLRQLESGSESQALNQVLFEYEAQFESIFAQAAVGIALVSPQGRWLRVNQQICRITGYAEAELLTKTFQDITHPDDLEGDLALVHQVLSGSRHDYTLEKRYRHRAGHWIWIALTVSLVRGPDEEPLYFISVIQDISVRKQLEQALAENHQLLEARVEQRTAELQRAYDDIRALSITDELTGLNNRRGFYMLANQSLAQLIRQKGSCAVLFMDLDGLKQANDQGGHEAGDALIVNAAEVLRQTCRDSDIVARMGGDEFCLFAPNPSGDSHGLTRRLKQAMEKRNQSYPSAPALSASVGLITAQVDEGTTLDALLRQADSLMYERKRRRKEPPDIGFDGQG